MTTVDTTSDRDRHHLNRTLPPVLSLVSGYVDTVGFLGLFGLLTSQVTGSFVAAGTGLFHPDPGLVAKLLAIPTFMAGAVLMTVLVAILTRLKLDPIPWALVAVGLLVAGVVIAGVRGQPFDGPGSSAALTTAIMAFLAMGAESALVRVLFKGSVPANFMTGNVTQVAVESTDMLLARARLLFDGDAGRNAERAATAWRQLGILLPMISGFVVGCGLGAYGFLLFGFGSLVFATALILLSALWAWRCSARGTITPSAP